MNILVGIRDTVIASPRLVEAGEIASARIIKACTGYAHTLALDADGQVCIYVYFYAYIYACIYMYVYVYVSIYMYVYVNVCIYMYI